MKIALVNPTFMKGKGIDRVIFELAKKLNKWFEVDVVCAKSDYQQDAPELNVIQIPARKIFGYEAFSLYFKLSRFLEKYDLINPHHEMLNVPSLLSHKPAIATYHGFQRVHGGNIIRSLIRLLVLESHGFPYRFNKRIIAVSKYLKKELVVHFHVPDEKIEVVYNGIDFDKFKAGEDKNYMLFVGRHERYKSIHELLYLVKETEFPLITVGSGREFDRLRELAEKLGIRDKVKFMGNVSENKLAQLYSNCSFFVSASKWEGFGLIFAEAAACKKPSVGYNLCSIPEVVEHNKTGFLVNNSKELTKYAKLLIESYKLRRKFGLNAFKYAKKKFNWNVVAKRYYEIFTKGK